MILTELFHGGCTLKDVVGDSSTVEEDAEEDAGNTAADDNAARWRLGGICFFRHGCC